MRTQRRRQASRARARRRKNGDDVNKEVQWVGQPRDSSDLEPAPADKLARGVEATKAWLAERKMPPYRFALDHGIDPTAFAKLLRGERKRISLEHASVIEKGTGGAVPLEIWRA